jgi:hypothetical protein
MLNIFQKDGSEYRVVKLKFFAGYQKRQYAVRGHTNILYLLTDV